MQEHDGRHLPRLVLLMARILACSLTGTGMLSAQISIPIEQDTLPNGLTVILHRDATVPVAAVMVMYHVGSKNERPGRTGFAHLFEHVMFKGSQHIGDGEHFKLLQEIGANINGSTTEDRTNYFEVVPANSLELALFMESDRMGFLLPALNQQKLDNQRDVVKNERRQNYDNQPYGTAEEKIAKALYPAGHPYSWPVIGYMEDLTAATLGDVTEFFRLYYAPNNACLVVSGNFDPAQVKGWIRKYFGDIPRGKKPDRPAPVPAHLSGDVLLTAEDNVQLPRLYMYWPSGKGFTRQDAVLDVFTDILSSGKNSRLYKALVYDQQVAQSVSATQEGSELDGILGIQVTAKPGKTLAQMESAVNVVLNEVLEKGVTEHEIQTALNTKEAQLVGRLATVLGKAGSLATFHTLAGDAGLFNKEFERYQGITPAEVLAAGRRVCTGHKVVLSVVPKGKRELAAGDASGAEARP